MIPILAALGFLDFLSALLLILLQMDTVLMRPVMIGAAYLIGKGLLFHKDIASILDIIAGLYMLLALLLSLHTFLAYLFAIYLVQKFVFSFL